MCCGRDHMVVGFTTTCVISAYHHQSCEFESRSWQCVLDTALCDIVCQLLVTDRCFSKGTAFSTSNKTDCLNITEILLNVTLSTITLTLISRQMNLQAIYILPGSYRNWTINWMVNQTFRNCLIASCNWIFFNLFLLICSWRIVACTCIYE